MIHVIKIDSSVNCELCPTSNTNWVCIIVNSEYINKSFSHIIKCINIVGRHFIDPSVSDIQVFKQHES